MAGHAVEGERTRRAPAKLLVTDVMKELETGPYVLPFASCQATDAVSVRLPEGCAAGTANAADADADAPDARVDGTPVTVPVAPLGTLSLITIPEAVAPPPLLSAKGLVSVVPAAMVDGPDLAMERIGRCSIVVTGAAGGSESLPLPPAPPPHTHASAP